jgi:hypothetical protein
VNFTQLSPDERAEMLHTIGIERVEQLFTDVPEDARFPTLDLPPALTELEASRHLAHLALALEDIARLDDEDGADQEGHERDDAEGLVADGFHEREGVSPMLGLLPERREKRPVDGLPEEGPHAACVLEKMAEGAGELRQSRAEHRLRLRRQVVLAGDLEEFVDAGHFRTDCAPRRPGREDDLLLSGLVDPSIRTATPALSIRDLGG